MTDLALLAEEVGADERTLRRAANRGAIRCRREGQRRIYLSAGEYEYVRASWPVLGQLTRELRTLPQVRVAVVFGSVARGDDRPESDLDLMVRLRPETIRVRSLVADRLECAIGRRVQLVGVEDAPPLLLADVLQDGRVLVDREGEWERTLAQGRRIRHAAARAGDELERAAWSALEQLSSS